MVTLGRVPRYTSSYALVRPSPSHSAASSTRNKPRFGVAPSADVLSRASLFFWAVIGADRSGRIALTEEIAMRNPFVDVDLSSDGYQNGVPALMRAQHGRRVPADQGPSA